MSRSPHILRTRRRSYSRTIQRRKQEREAYARFYNGVVNSPSIETYFDKPLFPGLWKRS